MQASAFLFCNYLGYIKDNFRISEKCEGKNKGI